MNTTKPEDSNPPEAPVNKRPEQRTSLATEKAANPIRFPLYRPYLHPEMRNNLADVSAQLRASQRAMREAFAKIELPGFLQANGSGSRINEIDVEVAKLRAQIAEKEAALAQQAIEFAKKNEELQKTLQEKSLTDAQQEDLEKRLETLSSQFSVLKKEQDLGNLVDHVCPAATKKLLSDTSFRKRFEEAKTCNAFVLAIDIRRSTDLMLRAKTHQQYADFLDIVCQRLSDAIKDQLGVVDKFTGDGLLAYFPDFFAGKDASYRALSAAQACHAIFQQTYRDARTSFTVVLKDVGLGIGIDFGVVHLLRVSKQLTVVGAPVVYACRLSGAPSGHTFMNHSAVAELEMRCKHLFHVPEVDFDVKHEGLVACQDITLSAIRYEPGLPDWLSDTTAAEVPPSATAPAATSII